ncbi:CmpA/NrtA family ABC transporter substrate-binding protein [Amphiplicatus metriothermophilus]|uniref:Nitrate/nitrite transport system substrate-binding protein n=1 Tax=Amphiplicatus metriothermophilus TaxID=1519374 RepID=A0A239PPC7_9PROT|nr:CmpA/NrtA family ABC transporter substrate-binding protein [Amphiplicatus metriothermophilus]MBB5518689.1 nitrate/nitrite transport system substrate-binding protein [Amphiplicatus metriothermophilus]SNT72154.1 nitrate/nitrite transport system substrate-binding protein [Amphiplicatus metriothermophilus]
MKPEISNLTIGFVPLTDAAPLVVAQEKGFFEKYGLHVCLSRENSWSQIRDKLAAGAIDAAHMLAPMAPASWLANAYAAEKFVTAVAFNLNGNAVTVSEKLYQEMVAADPDAMFERPTSARALKAVIAERLRKGRETVTVGAVFPFSSHNYALRYWLGAEGVNPDRDVRMVVAPPPFMVDQLDRGKVDMFCVGEPWNTLAEHRGLGRAIVRSADIWRHMPEKALGVRQRWAEDNPDTHIALVSSLLEALIWLDERANRMEAAYLLASERYVGLPAALLAPALVGKGALRTRRSIVEAEDFLIFHHYAANYPWRSHALWFLSQMARWGQIEAPANFLAIADGAYRPDIYRIAAARLGVAAPLCDAKTEGAPDRAWVLTEATAPIAMSASAFIDGGVFDPAAVGPYIEGFIRHNLRIDPSQVYAGA